MRIYGIIAISSLLLPASVSGADRPSRPRLIYDTDMGNDIDDALALGVIHALQSRGECDLLAVTISKDNPYSAAYIDLVNTFYGRPDIPIGAVRKGKTPKDGKYVRAVAELKDSGRLRYPRDLRSGFDAPEAVLLLRKTLANQPNDSVVFVVVGFSTNIARLLDSPGDSISPLKGVELIAQKCRLLSIMAGSFGSLAGKHKEYNVVMDLPAARKVYEKWPTPIVASGYEVGRTIKYPAVSIQRDYSYVLHHPLRDGYVRYMKMPYDRETWDLTSALYGVRPDRGYFGTSEPGRIRVDKDGYTRFTPDPNGKHRYLTVDPEQITRVREALVQLASQPPDGR